MFIYSKRKGTRAYQFKDTVKREEKVARINEIIAVQMDITKQKSKSLLMLQHSLRASQNNRWKI